MNHGDIEIKPSTIYHIHVTVSRIFFCTCMYYIWAVLLHSDIFDNKPFSVEFAGNQLLHSEASKKSAIQNTPFNTFV